MTITELNEFFDSYIKNWNEKNELEESLKKEMDRESWLATLKARSVRLRDLYMQNTGLIDQMKAFLEERGDDFTEEEAATIFEGIMRMYYDDCDDLDIMQRLLTPLKSYYYIHKDFSKLVAIAAVSFYYKVEVLDRVTGDVPTDVIMEDVASVLGYKAFYKNLDIESRRKIFSIYYNVAVVCLDADKLDMDMSYYYMQEMLAFWNLPFVKEMDKDDERISTLPDRIRREWIGFCDKVLKTCPEVKEYYMATSDEFYEADKAAGLGDEQISYETYSAHVTTRCMRGEITWEEGFDLIADYYIKRRDFLRRNKVEEDTKLYQMSYEYMDYLYFHINQPQLIVAWINEHNIPKDKYAPYVAIYLQDLEAVWDELYHNLPSAFLDTFAMHVCVKLIAEMEDPKERRGWLNRILVKRDIPTYIHATMVARLASLIADNMLEDCPEAFTDTWDYSVDEMRNHKEDIINFIETSAYYHDIGKTKIGDVVNTQTRKINDTEFNAIKNHPSHGAELTKMISDLSKYHDVILGHHKFYDGSAGYPAEFDNTKSKVRFVIDLITVCDCIDAATDILGRNYANPKTCDQVLDEIYKERGTRYNPVIAEYLSNNENLKEQLRLLITDGRYDCYYQIYEEFLANDGKSSI